MVRSSEAKNRETPGVYKVEYFPPPGGIKSKSLEIRKKIKNLKKKIF